MVAKKKRFTDLKIKKLAPKGSAYDVREGEGFGIRVLPSGSKSWFFMYHFDGRKKRLTLGRYPHATLEQARKAHREALSALDAGIDPGEERDLRKEAVKVVELVDFYIKKWAKPRKRSWSEDKRQLDKDVIPRWGHRKAIDISRVDVRRLLDDVADRAPIAANRLLAVIRKMFNFALDQGFIEMSPCLGIKAPSPEHQKERVLSESEIKAFWHGVTGSKISSEARKALQLILITAQRPTEICTMRWEDIDGEWWTIPGEISKNKKAHRVPLSPLAMEVLGERGVGYVLPPPISKGEYINRASVSQTVIRGYRQWGIEESFTPHDLRRTAASHMTGMGIPRLVVQRILNHAEQGVTAVYDRHSYDKEKRTALEAWSRSLGEILGDLV